MRTTIISLFPLVCLLYSTIAIAQHATLTGRVTGVGSGLPSATVSLLNTADSSWVRSELTDDKGVFSFNELTNGSYIISTSTLGFKTGMLAVTLKDNDRNDYTIDLQKESTSLTEVAVTAKKPFIEMSLGKTIVNIEGTTTTAGSNVLDLLRRLPGITVDQNGGISMNGKQGVLVLINDRETYLSGDDLAEYLKTITADDLSQIELITQPGSKYEASGNNGIINVKMKKNRKQGWNGNVSASYGQGVYFHRNESLLLNYKKNKFGLSLTVSDMEAIGFADWNQELQFMDPATDLVTQHSTIHSHAAERFAHTAAGLTADYEWSENTKTGISIRSSYHPNISHNLIDATIVDPIANTTTYQHAINTDGQIRKDIMINTYLTHKFSKESVLDINVDVLAFDKSAYQDYVSTDYDWLMQPLPGPLVLNSKQPSAIDVYSFKADHTYSFGNGLKLESGVKSSWVTTDNNAVFSLYNGTAWVGDTSRSNRFVYRENINAAYATVSKKIGEKWEAKVGIRAEQTIADGLQYVHNSQFNRNYISVFPTAYITYKADSNNRFELNYGRRIERPNYRQLNPFVYYSFQYTIRKGNPFLEPQYTNNIELKHSYKNMLISTVGLSAVNNVFNDALEVSDTSKTVYNIDRNAGLNNSLFYGLVFNKDITKWWSLNAGGSVFTAMFRGLVNNVEKEVHWSGYSVNLTTQISFGRGWKAEAYSYYNSKGRWSLTSSFDGNVYMEFGGSKKINDHFLVRAFVADPFYLYRIGIHSSADNFRSDSKYGYASQMFSLALTYTFGGKPATEQKDKTIDEAGRIR